jgi:hydroxymethylglutaryl-CoA lyase
LTDRVILREVGLRDGLQLIKSRLDTAIKLAWIRAQADVGFTEIEVTSFVPISVLPQFADATTVLADAQKIGNLLPSVLVPNLRGAVMAMDAGARKITFVLSVSDSHNRANVRQSTDDSLAMLRDVLAERDNRQNIKVATALATSFGCSIEGAVSEARVTQITEILAKQGIDEINLADTVGYGDPAQVGRIFTDVQNAVGELPLAAHFHDTRGLGLANVMAALDAGVRRFDSALGGLGGCPFAPGASGNIATEDTVHLFDRLGIDSGINLGALLEVRHQLAEWLPGEKLEGRLLGAGPADR